MKLTEVFFLWIIGKIWSRCTDGCVSMFAHNRDDHAKNFSWIYDEQMDCWHPSLTV